MKVMLCGGNKTDNIAKGIRPRFKMGGTEILIEQDITNIESWFTRGEYFDRAVIMEPGWTHDGADMSEIGIRQRIADFITVMKGKAARNATCVFVATDEEMAQIVAEESIEISTRCKVLVKKPAYTATFCVELVKTNLDEFDSSIVYDLLSSRPVNTEDDEEIIWSDEHGSEQESTGYELGTIKDIGFNENDIDVDTEDLKIEAPEESPSKDEEIDFDSDFFGDKGVTTLDFNAIKEDFKAEDTEIRIDEEPVEEGDIIDTEDKPVSEEPYITDNIDDTGTGDVPAEMDDTWETEEDSRDTVKLVDETVYTIGEVPYIDGTGDNIDDDPLEIDDDPLEIDDDPLEIDDDPLEIDDDPLEIDDDPSNSEDNTELDFDIDDDTELQIQDNEEPTETLKDLFGSSNEDSLADESGEQPTNDNKIGADDIFESDEEPEINDTTREEISNTDELTKDLFGLDDAGDLKENEVEVPQEFDQSMYKKNTIEDENDTNAQPVEVQLKKQPKSLFGKKKEVKLNKKSRAESKSIQVDATNVMDMLNTFKNRGSSLVVTGTPCSGTSTVVFNLANTISELGYTVLIVDMDTINRTQAFMSHEAYEAVHSLDPENASLKQALNTVNNGISRYVNIIKPGFHVLTMGLAGDIVTGEKLAPKQKLARFSSNVRNTYNFIIYDIPFNSAVDYAADITFTADNIVLCCEASTHGLMAMMLAMCNVESEDMQEALFSRAQLCLTKHTELKKVLGSSVSSVRDILNRLDKEVQSLLGIDPEYYFSNLGICGILKYDTRYEDGWFSEKAFSDTPDGKNEYIKLLTNILLKK